MSQLEERTVKQHEAPELFDQIEKSLTEADGLVELEGRAWRVVDFARDDYAVLVLQAEGA
jgi:hypothetical protein